MATVIHGGCSFLRNEGWTARLSERLAEGTVVNRSIGASTTLMAMFRLLTQAEDAPKPGDTVIWEYALNEAAHCAKGYDAEIAHRNLLRFIAECARRDLKLVAAIFTTRADELAEERSPYYDRLLATLRANGVACFDVSTAWRAAKGVRHMARSLYSNPNHYGDDAELNTFITDGVLAAMAAAAVPVLQDATHQRRLAVQLFDGTTLFQNSLMSLPVAPNPSTMVMNADAVVIGVVALAHPFVNCALRLEVTRTGRAGHWVNISTTTSGKGDKTILKAMSLEAAVGSGWSVQPGDRLSIQSLAVPAPVYAENHVRRSLASLDANAPAAFIGLVLEVDA